MNYKILLFTKMDLKRKKNLYSRPQRLGRIKYFKRNERRSIEPITIEKHELDLLDQYNVDKWFRAKQNLKLLF